MSHLPFCGGRRWIRTTNTGRFRPLLYRWSYPSLNNVADVRAHSEADDESGFEGTPFAGWGLRFLCPVEKSCQADFSDKIRPTGAK
jgi:hypothetical protein